MKGKQTEKGKDAKVILSLYVAGATPQSRAAIAGIKEVLQKHLPDTYQLSVVDIYQNPDMAKKHQIIAVPTLIKEAPAPLKLFIGDLTQFEGMMDRIIAA